METDYDVLGLAALPNDDELLPQIFAPDFMHLLNEADFLDEVPVVAQSTSLPVDPATTAAASGADMRPQMSPLFVPSSASDATAQPQQQLEGDLLVVTQQQEQGMLLFDQQLYRAASASSVGDGISAAGSPAHSAPGSPISSRPVSSSATTALKFGQQRSSSQPSPSAADDDTRTAVSAAIHLLQQQHQQQLRRSGQHQQWQQQQQQQSPAVSQACLPQEEKPLTNAQLAALKRKAPEVNWRSIQDPEERRKQRRLAKNRVTAARSRERKKEQMADLSARLNSLESDNHQLRDLLATLLHENTSLKEQLASLTRGAMPAAIPAVAPPAAAVTDAVLSLPVQQQQPLLLPVKTEAMECGPSPEPAVLNRCLAIMHLVCWWLVFLAVEASLRNVSGVFAGWCAAQQQLVVSSVAAVAGVAAAVKGTASSWMPHKQRQAAGRDGGRDVAGACVAAGAEVSQRMLCGDCQQLLQLMVSRCRLKERHEAAPDLLDVTCAAGAVGALGCRHWHTAAAEVLVQQHVAVAA